MNYREYKKGSSALRRIINDEELEYSRQFAKFNFSFNDRYQPDRQLRGIWNAKTSNVVAFINSKGNVFIRPTSVYATQLLNSDKNKVIKNNNMRALRNKMSSHIKLYSSLNLHAEKTADRLIANKDKPKKVYIMDFITGQNVDEGFIFKRIKDLLSKEKLPNTLFALNNRSLAIEQVATEDKHKLYLEIEDYSEAIEREERLDRIKNEIAGAFVDNIREIAQHSIISRSNMNPIQFSYTTEGEELVTGRIMLNRFDMSYPRELAVSEWLKVRDIANLIRFEERVGSLAERGINEMAQREEQSVHQQMANYVYQQQVDAAQRGFSTVDYAQWARGRVSTASAHLSVSADEARRLVQQAPDFEWDVAYSEASSMPDIFLQEYPTTTEAVDPRTPDEVAIDQGRVELFPF